jgi:uncharacterized protein with HEPN domain
VRSLAQEAVDMLGELPLSDFESDRKTHLAVTFLTVNVGEAAYRLSEADRRRYSRIDWSRIVGIRHRLVHGYDEVDLGLVWRTVNSEFPQLIAELDAILGPEDDAP